ncbi:MAG: SCO family protein [Verrucomicrobiota bacterium]
MKAAHSNPVRQGRARFRRHPAHRPVPRLVPRPRPCRTRPAPAPRRLKPGRWLERCWIPAVRVLWILCVLMIQGAVRAAGDTGPALESYSVTGVVERVDAPARRVTIRHEAVPGYMPAMTMPFEAGPAADLSGIAQGTRLEFQLHVNETNSWIDHLVHLAGTNVPTPAAPAAAAPAPAAHPLMQAWFTNELGRPVRLSDFRGQALAITFIFTRCPVPNFCPRLSRNFEEASRALEADAACPTNWHFLSVTFDPDFDTPDVLLSYARRYAYDPRHWSFLTGSREQVLELARLSGVEIDNSAGLMNHNFRTLVTDPSGTLRVSFPFGGDLSTPLAAEVRKALGAPAQSLAGGGHPAPAANPAGP